MGIYNKEALIPVKMNASVYQVPCFHCVLPHSLTTVILPPLLLSCLSA